MACYNADGLETLGDLRRHNGRAATCSRRSSWSGLRVRLADPPPLEGYGRAGRWRAGWGRAWARLGVGAKRMGFGGGRAGEVRFFGEIDTKPAAMSGPSRSSASGMTACTSASRPGRRARGCAARFRLQPGRAHATSPATNSPPDSGKRSWRGVRVAWDLVSAMGRQAGGTGLACRAPHPRSQAGFEVNAMFRNRPGCPGRKRIHQPLTNSLRRVPIPAISTSTMLRASFIVPTPSEVPQQMTSPGKSVMS